MKKLLGAALSVILLANSPQTTTSASAPMTGATAGSPIVERIYEAGRCILNADRSEAVHLLRTLPLDDSEADLSSLSDSSARECADAAAGAPSILLRGAIAQAMFFRDFRRFGRQPTRPERLVDLNLPIQDSTAGEYPIDLYRWADCVVRNDTVNTHRLLTSSVGSAEEGQALAQLQPYMSVCHRGAEQLTLRPSEARSVLAQSAYDVMYRYWSAELNASR